MIPTNANVTIYNDFGTGTGRRFIKHVINDVYWSEVKGQNVISMGVTTADSIKMFCGLKDEYISPENWQLLTLDEVMTFKYFTLRIGDILVLGTPDSPNEFTSSVEVTRFFGTAYAHIISSVDAKIMPGKREIHHFEISGA